MTPMATLRPPPPEGLADVMLDGVVTPAREAVVSVFDAGFTLGDGIFETVWFKAGAPVALEAHLDRLVGSAAALGLPIVSHNTWHNDVDRWSGAAWHQLGRPTDAVLRLQLTGGTAWAGPTRILSMRSFGAREYTRRAGLHAISVGWGRAPEGGLGGHKTSAWMPGVVALRSVDAAADPTREPLHTTTDGHVLEGATTSILARFGTLLVTAPLDGRVLAGVTRARTLALARVDGFTLVERPLELRELSLADEVIATNALLPASPLLTVDGVPLRRGGWLDTLVLQLSRH